MVLTKTLTHAPGIIVIVIVIGVSFDQFEPLNYKIKSSIDNRQTTVAAAVFLALTLSIIVYCFLNTFFLEQKRIFRIISGAHYLAHTTPLFSPVLWFPLPSKTNI